MNESSIVTACCTLLKFYENQKKLYYIRNNSGAIKTGNRFLRFGKSGSADILLFLPNHITVFCEVKTEKGRQTPNQIESQKFVESLGYTYCIIRSLKELEILLKKYLL